MEEFKTSAASEIPRLLTLTDGRGLVLMAARSRMEFVRDHARPVLDNEQIPLLAQGDDTAPALVERMRTELATSLIALRSFWEGVDIPGEALSLLGHRENPFRLTRRSCGWGPNRAYGTSRQRPVRRLHRAQSCHSLRPGRRPTDPH